MNKSCARCNKIVYPIEELKCLDKTWHKTCFKCHECGMTLNMKTYKGFNKLPYCEAHIPKAKATAIADTPELKRIAENTKIQSNVQYHADFEKQKGKLTQVADDPETLRIKQNTKHISNVEYHGDLAKKAAMEKQREVTEVADNRDNESEYFSETLAAESLSQYQQPSTPSPTQPIPPPSQNNHSQLPSPINQPQSAPVLVPNNSQLYASQNSHQHKQQQQQQVNQQKYQQQQPPPQQQQQPYQAQNNHHNNPNNYQSQNYAQQNNIRSTILQSAHNPSGSVVAAQHPNHQPKYYDQYDNYARPNAQNLQYQPQQQQQHNNNNPNAVYHNNHYTAVDGHGQYQQHPHHPQAHQQQHQQNRGAGYNNAHYNPMALSYSAAEMPGVGGIGKISDYDPLTDGPRNVPNATRPTSTLIFSSDRGMVSNSQNRRIGSINDIDPANGIYGSIDQNNYPNNYQQQQQLQQQQTRQSQQYAAHHQPQQQQQQQPPPSHKSKLRAFRAIYDYEAQDSDEVSFSEGDIIFEVESIDAGWMTGKVERSGKTGMLPANYVEPALI
ncbi:LIM and SH3 domain protein Lasp isoform X1 [Bradysia coprophila]|uniref:LIM and SH3 domain protein Lasp isoform X1 n=1 Tax=Bradysia coprophila TaxID=38358 RepID=UPI00187DD9F1|nr:LIM and SH3 domain protein Lasp isoform X1 [Bradysia coprophila]